MPLSNNIFVTSCIVKFHRLILYIYFKLWTNGFYFTCSGNYKFFIRVFVCTSRNYLYIVICFISSVVIVKPLIWLFLNNNLNVKSFSLAQDCLFTLWYCAPLLRMSILLFHHFYWKIYIFKNRKLFTSLRCSIRICKDMLYSCIRCW